MHRPFRQAVAAFAVAASLLLAACGGGGGGGSSSVPGTTATNAPSGATGGTPTAIPVGAIAPPALVSAGGAGGGAPFTGQFGTNTVKSVYTITSNPSGLAVTVDGAAQGTTPTTYTPADDNTTHVVSIPSTGTNPFAVSIRQSYDGPHTLFYNRAGDSSGALALGSLQALRRAASDARIPSAALAADLRRPHQSFAGPGVVPTIVAVRYDIASLKGGARSPQDIERFEATEGRDTPTTSNDPLRIVAVPAGETPASFARRLAAHAEVAEVSPVHTRHALSRPPTTVTDPKADNYNQWYLYATGVNYAWSYGTGVGTRIATIDTGVDNNIPDLASKIAFQEKIVTPTDATGNPLAGAKQQITPSAQDANGHGTNVAGIALAGANDGGFAGVAYGAQLLAYDVFPDATAQSDQQSTTTADEATAIKDAVARNADVINMSIGDPSFDTTEHDAVMYAISSGVVVCAAAGNSDQGEVAGTIDYPANYPGVIAVGASKLVDNNTAKYASVSGEAVTSYSQYGPNLAVVAPGGDAPGGASDSDLLHWINGYSTTTAGYAPDRCSMPSGPQSCTTLFNGTSQATPQVSGAAALLIGLAGGHLHLTPAQVQYLIESTADNIGDKKQGHGRLNAYRMMAAFYHDSSAFSGPVPQSTSPLQLVAFAYTNSGANKPAIADQNWPAGVPVGSDGSFRISDVPAGTSYRVGVWYDANGNGYIDAGDQIGVASVGCNGSSPCSIGTITMTTVTGTAYRLP